MDNVTREAVRSFHKLHLIVSALHIAPPHPADLETLSTAAYEANAALVAAGLLDVPQEEFLALVREEFPDYDTTRRPA
jgi:hypothetical protein